MLQIGNLFCEQKENIGTVLSIIAILWIFINRLKPKLEIEIDGGIKNQKIRVNVINKKRYFDANNLDLEICTKNSSKETNRLTIIDKEKFLKLPHKDNRIFRVECPQKIEDKLKETDTILRVRIHATHAYSGFGKVIEQCFQYRAIENIFIPIKSKNQKMPSPN